MIYGQRDAQGALVAISREATDECAEPLSPDSLELTQFADSLLGDHSTLQDSDKELVRVLEDLVGLLIAKGVILFTELPESAQQKIMTRQRLRSELGASLDLLDED